MNVDLATARHVLEYMLPKIGAVGIFLRTEIKEVDDFEALIHVTELWSKYRSWKGRDMRPMSEKSFLSILQSMRFDIFMDDNLDYWIVGARYRIPNDGYRARPKRAEASFDEFPLKKLKGMDDKSVKTIGSLAVLLGMSHARLDLYRHRFPIIKDEVARVVGIKKKRTPTRS